MRRLGFLFPLPSSSGSFPVRRLPTPPRRGNSQGALYPCVFLIVFTRDGRHKMSKHAPCALYCVVCDPSVLLV
ncbi:hypothetical protein GALMADRAFT_919540 [Galerina marginata CBS 339.88]|uniref:Uncharacterized protein n=1 Tax=Galerina marginata (strain CBS 339.88) TaxID=685588 RepID=A0A067SNY0_GALM3|nr:hypothetical protein GALMADRAFT_919540 [Galerina marginata CBS 339.88]